MIDNFMLLTKESGFILKPFALIIGYLIEGIYWVLDKVGIPNIGLAIVLLTIVIYILMLPLTYKQQKFSKLSSKMNPEIQAVQAKYKGKQDQESMMKMQTEVQAVYAKYGVSPSGSCIQLLIQMPILFALYRVIYNIPAYVGKVKELFIPLSNAIYDADKAEFIRSSSVNSISTVVNQYGKHLNEESASKLKDGIIDVLNRLSTSDLNLVAQHYDIADITAANGEKILSTVDSTTNAVIQSGLLERINTFIGLNISNSPSYTLKAEWALGSGKSWLIILGVILVPVLSALTQYINFLLMPQQANNGSDEANSMMASMKMMNKIMPLFSAYMCFILPLGLGIYWITGAVVRTIIQIILNKKIDKIDIDEMIKDNIEKYNEKRAKQGLPAQTVNNNATKSTRSINTNKSSSSEKGDRAAAIKDSSEYYKNAGNAKEGSLASKAFMVKAFNEKNNEKSNDKDKK